MPFCPTAAVLNQKFDSQAVSYELKRGRTNKTTGKMMTTENDIVLVHMENQPLFFARVEQISPDVKKAWFQIELLILQIPLQTVTWILRDSYIDGETFTMDGKEMRLEKVERQAGSIPEPEDEGSPSDASGDGSKVISFSDLQKKK